MDCVLLWGICGVSAVLFRCDTSASRASPERLAKYNVQRSAKWNGKNVMPQIEEQELFKRLQSGERMLIITNKKLW